MTFIELQEPPLSLNHSEKKLTPYTDKEHLFGGEISKLSKIPFPYYVIFGKISETGEYGQILNIDYIEGRYLDNNCSEYIYPENADYFFLVKEVPISKNDAEIIDNRLKSEHSILKK